MQQQLEIQEDAIKEKKKEKKTTYQVNYTNYDV